MEKLKFQLNASNAVETDLLTEIPDRDFGTEKTIDEYNIEIDIGKMPIAKNLRTLYELKGHIVPPELAIFKSYDIWIITQSLNIPINGDFRKLKQVQFDVEYTSAIEGQRSPATIIDVFPQTKFKRIFKGKFIFNASIDLNGQIGVPTVASKMIRYSEVLEGTGKIQLSTDTDVVCNISFALLSPEIISVGIGNYTGSWILEKSENYPLVGDQLLMHTVLVPKEMDSIHFNARVSAVASGPFGLLPIRLQSEWESLEVFLS